MPVRSQVPLSLIKAGTARWFFALFGVLSGWLSGFAQNSTPGCLPYSANYPCIYVANFGSATVGQDSTVSVINATTSGVIQPPISVGNPNGSGAQAVVVSPDNAFAYVALQFRNAVAVIDTSSNTVTATIPLSSQPSQLAVTPDGAFVWVAEPACDGCRPSVEVINTKTNQVEQKISGLVDPTAITFALDGSIAYIADSCGNFACIDLITTSDYAPYVPKPKVFLTTLPFFAESSITITPDGSLLCISVLVNVSTTSTYGVTFVRTSDQSVLSSLTFSQAPDSNYGLAVALDKTLYIATNQGVVLVNTSNQTFGGILQLGPVPSGIAIAPDGATVYVTNSNGTVSILRGGLLAGTISGLGANPQGVAVMPSLPPTITSQPSSQTIASGQPATLTVTATGTPPLAYQWYQGQSGDTSAPIPGATTSSFTTPALSTTTTYWVAVNNLVTLALPATTQVTGAQSTTASVAPILHPPTCTLSLQGSSSFYTVTATANCTDPQQQPLTTLLSWGDGTSTPANGGALVTSKAYSPVQAVTPYPVNVSSTDSSQLTGSADVSLFLSPTSSVFAGQSANVGMTPPRQPPSGDPVKVSFDCTTVINSSGQVSSASSLGISCSSTPSVVTLDGTQAVKILIQTTGPTISVGLNSHSANWLYALLLPVPACLWLGVGFGTARTRRKSIYTSFAVLGVAVLLSLVVSCGGGFTAPRTTQLSTPAGSYQITVVDMLVGCQTPPCQNTSNFVQTTLIVPLTVSPTQ